MKRFFRDDSGQALALVALSMSVLLGFAALALDIGGLIYQKARMQKAADAAALAAVMELPYGATDADLALFTASGRTLLETIVSVGEDYAEANGCPAETFNVSVSPDLTRSQVAVTIEKERINFFAGIFQEGPTEVRTTAVAQKWKQWEGVKGQLPFMNISRDYVPDDDFEFRDKEDENSSVRDWIALNKYSKDLGDLDLEQGLKVAPGGKNGWLSEVDYLGPGIYYIFTLNTELLPFQSKPGIAVNGAPIKGDLNNLGDGSLIDRYAKMNAEGYYTAGSKAVHDLEQIKLLMVHVTSEEIPSGQDAFEGTVIGEYSLDHNFQEDEEFIAEWGKTRSRLVR